MARTAVWREIWSAIQRPRRIYWNWLTTTVNTLPTKQILMAIIMFLLFQITWLTVGPSAGAGLHQASIKEWWNFFGRTGSIYIDGPQDIIHN